jgi:ribose transport system permease protein/ribose transport system ATP-binding protein
VTNRLGLSVVCVALVIGLGIKYPTFLTVDNLFVTLLSVTSIGIAGLGTAALLISGNVDLSIGGQYAFISVAVGLVARDIGSTELAIATGLIGGFLLGYINGRLVRLLQINPLIVTLGMATLLHGFAFVLSDGVSVSEFPDRFVSIGRTYFGPVPLPVVVGGIVFVVGSVLLLRTVGGLRVYAIGGSRAAARLSGIPTERYVTWLYGLNGMLIGLVAVLSISRLGSASPTVGTDFALRVLTAVILGGVAFTGGSGHPVGVFVGVATIGVLNAGVVFAGVSSYWQQVVQGGALMIALGADQLTARRRAGRRTRADEVDVRVPAESTPAASLVVEVADVETPQQRKGTEPVLRCRGLTKRYGSITAATDVSFDVAPGEILCLVGDNGAGKSTVVTMLSGAITPDAGTIEVDGQDLAPGQPAAARDLGITTVYQDLALCPNLGVAENLTLGHEPRRTRGGVLAWRDDRTAEAVARQRLAILNISLPDYWGTINVLSGGQRQAVAIARAAEPGACVVILDEPTAALGRRQTESVLALVRTLAASGVAVIVITHELETVLDLAHRIIVLRLGAVTFDGPANDLSESALIHAMAGYPFMADRSVASKLPIGPEPP